MNRIITENIRMNENEVCLLETIREISGTPKSELLRRAFIFYVRRFLVNDSRPILNAYKKYFTKKKGGKKCVTSKPFPSRKSLTA